MKSNITQIASIYGPVVKKQKHKLVQNTSISHVSKNDHSISNISLMHKRPVLIKKDKSLKMLSVIKRRDSHTNLRRDSKSVEPLPIIKSITPVPSSPKKQLKLLSVDSSIDEEFKRLDNLMIRNQSARNDLLSIQKRILSLGVNKLIKNRRFMSIGDASENISFEQIDESLKDPCVLKAKQLEHKSSAQKLKLPPLSLL
ncbi:unnamed protein product [Blepharisma stoltei]|uniref:Uncharacterized protein n=1 Tax=Blepharisma stoltei TaxID=1481888 RepID=A0AAU9K091_9CILI|nr:unnamed protein product [Blepharisma stoltei]